MIITVTLSPTIDKTVYVNNFQLDLVNEIYDTREDAGGKGINVSKMIKKLEGNSIATGCIGGRVGNMIIDKLQEDGINYDFVPVQTNSRYNIKLVDIVNKSFTDINESGGVLTIDEINNLENKIFSLAKEGDTLVLSGRVPSSIESNIYRKWIEIGKGKGIKTIIDADLEPLREAVLAGPYVIKPNIHELERLFQENMNSIDDIRKHVNKLYQYGIKIVIVSLGDKGAYLFTKEKELYYKGLEVDVKSTVGAGDSMVGAFAYAIDNNYSIEDAFTLSVSVSTATVQKDGTVMAELEEVNDMKIRIDGEGKIVCNNL
ncbi:MAG: 1-phosphofructokinase [Vallitalea sp.]|jgi:1-phosphofructokinase|nr:1-phosphofructokinase [Vallitalea sp.]